MVDRNGSDPEGLNHVTFIHAAVFLQPRHRGVKTPTDASVKVLFLSVSV